MMTDHLFAHMMGEDQTPKEKIAIDIDAARLRDAFAVYQQRHTFVPGQLVREKTGLTIGSSRRSPNNLYVVLEHYPDASPYLSQEAMAQGIWGQMGDLVVGCYDEDGDFVFIGCDSRRFEPAREEDLVP